MIAPADLRSRVADAESRAQLVLAGAVVIAAVIIGLSLLLNSILYTETTGSESVNSRIDAAKVSDFEFRKGVRSLILRVNHAGWNLSGSEVQDNVRGNVSLYSHLLAETHAKNRPIGLNVSYHDTNTKMGLRIVQDSDANLTANDGTEVWRPVPVKQQVGWFTMNVDLANTSEDVFRVVAENNSNPMPTRLTFRMNRTVNGTLQVNQTLDPPGPGDMEFSTECDPSSGRVLLDMYAGTAFTGDCSFLGTDVLSGPSNGDVYDVQFQDGKRLHGKFDIVFNKTSVPFPVQYPVCDGLAPDDATPCRMEVVWQANVTTAIASEELTYDNQYFIDIYARNR